MHLTAEMKQQQSISQSFSQHS